MKDRENAIRAYLEALCSARKLPKLVIVPIDPLTCPTELLEQLTRELGNGKGISR